MSKNPMTTGKGAARANPNSEPPSPQKAKPPAAKPTKTKTKPAAAKPATKATAPPSNIPALRIALPDDYRPQVEECFKQFASDGMVMPPIEQVWRTYTEAVWPSAKTIEGIILALSYCSARNLDPMKRVIHIVPMWNKKLNREVETVWPGIAELRTTASRTGAYAGKDAPVFGDYVEASFEGRASWGDRQSNESWDGQYPEWAQVTMYRMVAGQRCAFTSNPVFWVETYAPVQAKCPVPNSMWRKRPIGQLAKCVEAEGLREAFPEELGGVYAAEEMEGKIIDDGAAIIEATPIDGGAHDITPSQKPERIDYSGENQEVDAGGERQGFGFFSEEGTVLARFKSWKEFADFAVNARYNAFPGTIEMFDEANMENVIRAVNELAGTESGEGLRKAFGLVEGAEV